MECYDSSKESKYITYLDANNLYKKEIDRFDRNSIEENSSMGYILKVDLKYLGELHELHNDYPLAAEKLKISQNMLSNYCFSISNEYGIKIDG